MRVIPSPSSFLAGLFAAVCLLFCLFLSGCLDAGTGPRKQDDPASRDPVVNLRMGVAGVKSLSKGSVISLDRLVITFSSSANDTIRDTVTELTTPALNPASTSPQIIAKNYALKALRSWKVVVTSRDAMDSVIHQDSATVPVLYAGDTAVVNLGLAARYSMFEANFLNIPDSIASATGTHKQVLRIDRLMLAVNGRIVVDSFATPGPYFAPLTTHALPWDYAPSRGGWLDRSVSPDTGTVNFHTLALAGFGGVTVGGGVAGSTFLGLSWEFAEHFGGFTARSVVLLDDLSGFMVGGSLSIFRIHPGLQGSTPLIFTEGSGSSYYGVHAVGASHAWAVGDSGKILFTADAGETWNPPSDAGTSQRLRAVWFAGTATGWAVGDNGTVIKTTDGGDNWSASTPVAHGLRSVHFIDGNTGWAVGGSGTILKTVNGGTSWNPQTSGTTAGLNSVRFTHADTGWVVGGSGTILKTVNGGASWIPQAAGLTGEDLNAVAFNAENGIGVAVGNNGTILAFSPGTFVSMAAFGPMNGGGAPLFLGHAMVTTAAGNDDTVPLMLEWVGPATGSGTIEAELGRVGTTTIDGSVPETVSP